ncbi:hypothetical protein KSP40_PGU017315 [Platanthera guangdongensis]|uniref:Adenylate kinase n=1 Tax=Platanthera guangdongensis TaxID=2320717 RepID=A0ABR2MN18_9ASPA
MKPDSLKIMISGAPASGKGTQCELLKKKMVLPHKGQEEHHFCYVGYHASIKCGHIYLIHDLPRYDPEGETAAATRANCPRRDCRSRRTRGIEASTEAEMSSGRNKETTQQIWALQRDGFGVADQGSTKLSQQEDGSAAAEETIATTTTLGGAQEEAPKVTQKNSGPVTSWKDGDGVPLSSRRW